MKSGSSQRSRHESIVSYLGYSTKAWGMPAYYVSFFGQCLECGTRFAADRLSIRRGGGIIGSLDHNLIVG